MTWKPCSKVCKGQCPCPEPAWKWKCNQVQSTKEVDPQMRWQLPSKGYNVSSRKTMKHGFAYIGEYE